MEPAGAFEPPAETHPVPAEAHHPPDHHPDTRERLLQAAERLFAARGLRGTTVRDVTREAGTNLAAVNYHFGTKDGLALEVFRRRITPINEERLHRLRVAEERAGGGPVPVEELVRGLLEPALLLDEEEDPVLPGLLSRFAHESHPELLEQMRAQLREVLHPYLAAFRRSLPALDPTELRLRIHFLAGAMIHTVSHLGWLDLSGVPGEPPPERRAVLEALVRFCTDGFQAGPSGTLHPTPQREPGA